MRTQPVKDEYPEYYEKYIGRLSGGDIYDILQEQRTTTIKLFRSLQDDEAGKSYAPGKWTMKEVVGHMADTERVMAYRMLVIARGDTTPLSSFEQDHYVTAAQYERLPWEQIYTDFDAVRSATLGLIGTIDEVSWLRSSTVGGNKMSARALAYIIAGHELHHVSVIQDKYL
ncbi:DinB family protein [Alicyclobacillus curvatus]|jgi:uncharacterized damage-inducible protein DinB|nr:DinB family protein [Alicyclobacillus curvatus]